MPQTSNGRAIIALSWDGVVADTTEWRIRHGINAALTTWPQLTASSEELENDNTWLENKMLAIAPYLDGNASRMGDMDVSKTVEFSLLARLLLEEQQLDPSIGKIGKYSSQYHPQGSHKSISIPTIRSTRPLTVGEVQANWREYLFDTTLVRYPVVDQDGKKCNPIPTLEKNIIEQESATTKPSLQPIVVDALASSISSSIIITVQQDSDQRIAEETLASDSRLSDFPVRVFCENDISRDIEKNLELYVCSSWKKLQEMQRCRSNDSNEKNLPQLSLASWTSSVDQQNQAANSPFINVFTQDDLAERLSSRIFVADPS